MPDSAPYSASSTTTDFPGNVVPNQSSILLNAVNSAGFTVSVFSKVLCAVISGAVKTRQGIFRAFDSPNVEPQGLLTPMVRNNSANIFLRARA